MHRKMQGTTQINSWSHRLTVHFIAVKVHCGSVIKMLRPSVRESWGVWFIGGSVAHSQMSWSMVPRLHDMFYFYTAVICCFVPGPTHCSSSRCVRICLSAAAASFLQTTGLQVNPRSINKRATAPLAANMCTACNCGNKSYTMLAAPGETLL